MVWSINGVIDYGIEVEAGTDMRAFNSNGKRMAVALLSSFIFLQTMGTCLPVSAAQKVYRGSTSIVRQLRQANQWLQTGKFREAETTYTALLQVDPNNIEARGGLAVAQAELYKLDAAEKNARTILQKDPKNAMAHMVLGVVSRNRTASQDMTYRSQRERLLSDSARELERSIQLDPDSPEVQNQLGVTYRMQQRYSEAERQFQKALEMDPQFSEALLNQGIMRFEQGDMTAAKTAYQKAIQLNSKNHMAHYRLGEVLVQQGDLHGGLRSLNTALSLDQGNAAIMSKMAEAYGRQNNRASAVAFYRKSMLSNPQYMPAYTGLANLFSNRGDDEMAMAELKSALNINPNFYTAKIHLGYLALSADKPDQALQYFREAMAQNPQDSEVLKGFSQAMTVVAAKQANWAQSMGQESDLTDAEQAVQEALRYSPNDLRLHLASLRLSQLAGKPAQSQAELQEIISRPAISETDTLIRGEALFALGRYGESDQIYKDIITSSRMQPEKLVVLGDTLKSNGDLDRAKDAYAMVAIADPSNVKAKRGLQRVETAYAESLKSFRLAKALNNRSQKESAIDYYEETLSQNPRQPEARLALAVLYEKVKNYPRAIQSYQFYMSLKPDMLPKEKQSLDKKLHKLEALSLKAAK